MVLGFRGDLTFSLLGLGADSNVELLVAPDSLLSGNLLDLATNAAGIQFTRGIEAKVFPLGETGVGASAGVVVGFTRRGLLGKSGQSVVVGGGNVQVPFFGLGLEADVSLGSESSYLYIGGSVGARVHPSPLSLYVEVSETHSLNVVREALNLLPFPFNWVFSSVDALRKILGQ